MRVMVLIDGMNLYHSTSDLVEAGCDDTVRWLDVHSLSKSFLSMFGRDAKLERVFYFTSKITKTTREKREWQDDYLQALKDSGPVSVVLGHFIDKPVTCHIPECQKPYTVPVEKKTDVNIAIKIFELSYLSQCDVIVIVTGDTDLLDAIRLAKALFGKDGPSPHKVKYCCVFPYKRYNIELANNADFKKELKQDDYLKHPLPARVVAPPPPPPAPKKKQWTKWRR